MVSTRGVRYKFTEGERVLCYEPDPTKAKVLYDSKVLEVIESNNRRGGGRTVEYLIHFQGWNSSWDRCVGEDFVLKDTEENRQLQRDLAEKSQLQLGAYLYRRERKKGSGASSSASTGAVPTKRARHGFDDDGSSSSTQPDEGDGNESDSSSASVSSDQQHPMPPPHPHGGRAHITLPSTLRDRLTFDYHLVVKRGRLSQLPASPCAADILESFVRWFARAGAWNTGPRGRTDPMHRPDIVDVSCRLNLVREVVDGLRVYFDFILQGHLLYKQEIHQYHAICGQFMRHVTKKETEVNIKEEVDDEQAEMAEVDIKSPKIPEYSHLPPDPEEAVPGTSSSNKEEDSKNKEEDDKNNEEVDKNKEDDSKKEEETDERPPYEDVALKEEDSEPRPATRSANVARRLRSYKSTVSSSEPEEASSPSSTNPDPRLFETQPYRPRSQRAAAQPEEARRSPVTPEARLFETLSSSDALAKCSSRDRSQQARPSHSEPDEAGPSLSADTPSSSAGSSGSSNTESWAPQPAPVPVASTSRTPLSILLNKVAQWQIIPREGTDHLPCRVYGAIHLARLFVRLPAFLNATNMPESKLKLILKHIDMFVQFMNDHGEWFGETYYTADNISRSH